MAITAQHAGGTNHPRLILGFLLLQMVLTTGLQHWQPSSSERNDVSDAAPVPVTDEWVEDDEDNEGDVNINGSISPCRCWRVPGTDRLQVETACKCRGKQVLSVPNNLPTDVHLITLYSCWMERLGSGELQMYAGTLTDFVLDRANQLRHIEEGAFAGLEHLQRIYIRRAPLLISLPDGVFSLSLPSLHILLIKQTGLRVFPNLAGLETADILHMVDLEENELEIIPTNSVRLRVDDFLISGNALRSIEAFAFNGSQIATLNLKANRQLTGLHPDAFAGLSSLRRLDASQTAITSLPIKGLTELEILRLTDTKSLKEIPSVYNYQWLQEAYLTYPYHCCAFAFPATHDPEEHIRQQLNLAEMQAKYCGQDGSTNESRVIMMGPDQLDDYEGEFVGFVDLSVPSSSSYGLSVNEEDQNGGFFHQDPVQPPSDRQLFFHAFCGNVTVQTGRKVKCTPQPDAFNPCEDILGATWLRLAAWLVAVASLVGNVAVVAVLVGTSRCPIAVSKFLMVNLALADFCMGLYLFLIVGMDVNTIGVYFNYAIDWQNGIGCQVAGFLTVFATELSVFTLVVITSERWYTITYAINMSRRLRLSTTAKIVVVGWVGSLAMAALPLAGVSSFATTSICLPLENRDLSDTIYQLILLVVNGLAFLVITLMYGHMYRSISGQHQTLASHSDATVAKRMALLVFTNLACWTPIAFFGLTAMAGYPLISVTHTKILLVFFYPLNACTNPYLYALVTKQYRRDFFTLLARHGLCKERAARYRSTVSGCGRPNNPIRAGSQLELAMGVKTVATVDVNGKNKKLLTREPSKLLTKALTERTTSPKTSRESQESKKETSLELSGTQPVAADVELDRSSSSQSDDHQRKAGSPKARHLSGLANCGDPPSVSKSSPDSPHPIKNCQVRLGKDRTEFFQFKGHEL